MAEYTTEELRDSSGKVTAVRVTTVDSLGRPNYADVPVDQLDVIPSQGAGAGTVAGGLVVPAVAVQVAAAVKPVPQSSGPGAVLTLTQVQAISKKARGK